MLCLLYVEGQVMSVIGLFIHSSFIHSIRYTAGNSAVGPFIHSFIHSCYSLILISVIAFLIPFLILGLVLVGFLVIAITFPWVSVTKQLQGGSAV